MLYRKTMKKYFQSESTVNVNLAEDTIIKPGIELPKSESEWKTVNSFFHANLPIEDKYRWRL